MTNLLPTAEKESIRTEYRLRVLATILVGVLVVSGIAILLLIPSYIFTVYKSKTAENIISSIPVQNKEDVPITQRLTMARNAMGVVQPDTTLLLPTESISFILKYQTPSIKITSLTYIKNNTDPEILHVRGLARTRQSLVEFTDALRAEPRVATLDLPVSSFAKDTNILFDFTITTR